MKVKELIELLQKEDPEATLYTYVNGNYSESSGVSNIGQILDEEMPTLKVPNWTDGKFSEKEFTQDDKNTVIVG